MRFVGYMILPVFLNFPVSILWINHKTAIFPKLGGEFGHLRKHDFGGAI
jgi:hypothetical protein